ncbi:hypothetical protein [Nucisporomicrobium flavum]|uniref:hypothetical protein n=1 Tax=Nucisporomicrobium flavum TaxID=2785915 RepID=UPI0018F51944|nr:hypothetical protein [Nucisporomicrobium flavum]
MADRRLREVARWVALAAAIAALVVFVVAQRQSVDVSYGRSPSPPAGVTEGAAGELSDATVPSVEQMTALVRAAEVVRLPGSVARWDEQRVRAAMGAEPMRILVAPPGLDEAERDRVRDVKDATIRVIGTQVTGGAYQATGDSLDDWRAEFAAGDVTNLLITLIAGLREQPPPADVDRLRWREPTAAELEVVAARLRRTGLYTAPGATLTQVPRQEAFPGGDALYVALPRQSPEAPLLRYGPALTRLFPGRPIVELHGDWIEYHGPDAGDFAEVTAAGFYAQFGDRLGRYAYPQATVLGAYLGRVTDVRYAGLFDRPLPYRPADPLRVALPVLPWLFVACAGVFFALSVRSLLRPLRRPRSRPEPGLPARLAGLTALAVEMSALTDRRSEAALTRGITALTAARSALDDDLPDAHVRDLLAGAEADLDEAGRLLPYPGYRPADYLRERLA